ncbi:FISUMP domain-containing protein [Fibrobacter succinogenes]|uniref:FISUMP domain-containing protein n=1 Tax=Fibrobacter succinogenes TaxID=833 RepID=UPI001568F10A|nr:FISUMP domain-containing protein [Fibrobacter succinogenes]
MNSFLIKCALFISLLLAACSSENYESVSIGNQVWMARNLNRDIGGSFCYDNDSLNCEKYGRLYTWKAAQNACPEGWSDSCGLSRT